MSLSPKDFFRYGFGDLAVDYFVNSVLFAVFHGQSGFYDDAAWRGCGSQRRGALVDEISGTWPGDRRRRQ